MHSNAVLDKSPACDVSLIKRLQRAIGLTSNPKTHTKSRRDISAEPNSKVFAPNTSLPIQGEPNVDSFRKAFNARNIVGDDRFVSIVGADGVRLPARVESQNGAKLVLEVFDSRTGKVFNKLVKGENLLSIRKSTAAKELFTSNKETVASKYALPPVLPRSTSPTQFTLPMSERIEYDSFRDAFNHGSFLPDERFVSVPIGGHRLPAMVVDHTSDSVTLKVSQLNGKIKFVQIRGKKLESIRVSETAKRRFANPTAYAAKKPPVRPSAFDATPSAITDKKINAALSRDYFSDRIFKDWLNAPIPRQGFKLHVSATEQNAGEVAEAILPYLRELGVSHKVVGKVDDYINVMRGTQQGKFISIYPTSSRQAAEIAARVDDILIKKNLSGKFLQVPGEKVLGKSGGVFARYGEMTDDQINGIIRVNDENLAVDAAGKIIYFRGSPVNVNKDIARMSPSERKELSILLEQKGSLGSDGRGTFKPSWVEDPFK